MRGGADRVAHVVQAVEYAHEVVVLARVVLGRGDLEGDAISDARVLCRFACALDRGVVVVESEEPRVRERFGHDDRRRAVPAADVGDLRAALQLLLDSVQGRNPLGDEVRAVAGPEESLGATEQAMVVLVPTHPLAAAKRLDDLLFVGIQRCDRVIHAEDVERAVFVRQRKRVLVRQRVAVALRVVGDIATRGLVSQPLTDVALSRARALRDFLRGQRPRMSHRFIEAELLADQHQRPADDRAHVRHSLPHEGFQLAVVDLRRAHHSTSQSS